MIRRRIYPMIGALLVALAASAEATEAAEAAGAPVETMIRDAKANNVGVAVLTDTPNGLLIEVDFAGLPAGQHAFHIHETGKCEPPFESAGGHFNPGSKHHGFEADAGYHAGDLPDIVIPASGSAKVKMFTPNLRLRTGPAKLLDKDGAALVVHAGPDDYKTDPAGNAGDRIACGVVEALEAVKVENLEVAP